MKKRKPSGPMTHKVMTRVTEEDYLVFQARAAGAQVPVSEWTRQVLTQAGAVDPTVERSEAQMRRLMAEVFALRFVLLNTLPLLACSTGVRGEIEAEVRRLIEEADVRKADKALVLLGVR